MPRLIAFRPSDRVPAKLHLTVGDVLMFPASGGHILSGTYIMSMLGAYKPGVVGDDGQVIAPEGLPGAVLFCALGPGNAAIDVVTAIPGGKRSVRQVDIVVGP